MTHNHNTCPICKIPLKMQSGEFHPTNPNCKHFPVGEKRKVQHTYIPKDRASTWFEFQKNIFKQYHFGTNN